jgi:AcrR family transcriptional regulator
VKRIDPEALWAPPPPRRLGRPAEHSRATIVAAAITIADSEGLAALSMRRIAGDIGAGTMSLYSHVPDKEHLIELMVDAVIGEAEPTVVTGDPVADLCRHARTQRALFHRHTWLPTALAMRQTLGPHALAALDNILALLQPLQLDTAAKMEAFALVTGFIASYVSYELGQADAGHSTAEHQTNQARYLGAAAASGRYPHLATAFAGMGAAAAPVDPDTAFDRLVARVIAALIHGPG